jgi:hypothetical protein
MHKNIKLDVPWVWSSGLVMEYREALARGVVHLNGVHDTRV